MTEHSTEKSQVSENMDKTLKKRASARKTHSTTDTQLELFQRETDPGSHAVRNRLSQLGLDYFLRNVRLGDALKNEQLAQAGGKVEVPFLIDHRTGTKLYGAHAIIIYLDHEYGQKPSTPVLRVVNRLNSQVRMNADQLAWAVRAPLEQIQRLRGDTQEAVRVLGKSVATFRDALKQEKMNEESTSRASKKAAG
jgi:glutathione S-transferase